MAISKSVLDYVKQLVPPLTAASHKGEGGRVGVFGGSQEYTGAPYFAAMSALRMGADLAHVVCAPSAATAIKSYSPDIIVHPMFSTESPTSEVAASLKSLLSRLHVVVIGPGLGRAPHMQSYARLTLSLARERDLYVVLDADALYMIQNDPDLIRGYRKAVVTPNLVEFKRLCEAVQLPPETPPNSMASQLSALLGGVTVLQKGPTDVITFSFSSPTSGERERAEVVTKGGLKRCGGQGDVLSGVLGTMLCWGKNYEETTDLRNTLGGKITATRIPLLASVGAAIVTRVASRRGFERHGRATVTQDILSEVEGAFVEVFENGDDSSRRASLT